MWYKTTKLFTIEENLNCEDHEEADTKIVYHTCQLLGNGNVVIRCSDTDVLIIILSNMKYVDCGLHVYMEVGTGNNQRIIDVSLLYQVLGDNICCALPAFHAFTGCDYNPSFFKKGKNRPFSILLNSPRFQSIFINLSTASEESYIEVVQAIQEFTCYMYGLQTVCSVNKARAIIFSKTYNSDTNEIFRKNIKSFDASSLPPCYSELEQHIKRTLYIAEIWRNAHKNTPTNLNPLNYRWIQSDDTYKLQWFDGPQLPKTITEISSPKGIHIYFKFCISLTFIKLN